MEHNLSKTCVPFHLTSKMTSAEIEALRRLTTEVKHSIEPFTVTQILVGYGYVHHSAFTNLHSMFRNNKSRDEICEVLLQNIMCYCTFSELIHALFLSGNGYFGNKLLDIRQRIHLESNVWRVYRTECGNRRKINIFFKNIKRMIHDAMFDHPRQRLRQLANRFSHNLNDEKDEKRKQDIADKYIALLGAEIDAHAITFDNHLPEHNLFHELDDLTVQSSNTLLTNVIYYGRLANANAIAKKFDKSSDMLRVAQNYATFCGPSLELANMHYIDVYVKLWEYETNPNEHLRKQLISAGWFGLCNLEYETDESIKRLWRRMFILRMVFCLLGIGNRANVFMSLPVPYQCIEEARKLLLKIDEMWDGIETRREMFYYVARARLSAITNDIPMAIEYIKRARNCAMEGHFKELQFINAYTKDLQKELHDNKDQNAYRYGVQKDTAKVIDDDAEECACMRDSEGETELKVVEEVNEIDFSADKIAQISDVSYDSSITKLKESRKRNAEGSNSRFRDKKELKTSLHVTPIARLYDSSSLTISDTMEPTLPSNGHIPLPSIRYDISEGSCRHISGGNMSDSQIQSIDDSITRVKGFANENNDQKDKSKEYLEEKNREIQYESCPNLSDSMGCKLPSDGQISLPSMDSKNIESDRIKQHLHENFNCCKSRFKEKCTVDEHQPFGDAMEEYLEDINKRDEYRQHDSDSMGYNLPLDGYMSSPPIQHGSYDTQSENTLFLNDSPVQKNHFEDKNNTKESIENVIDSMECTLPTNSHISLPSIKYNKD